MVVQKRFRREAPLAILIISPQFRPILGGYERAAERLSAALADAGLQVTVITERREHAWPAVELLDGYEVRRLSCLYRRHCHAMTSLLSFAVFLLRHGRTFDIWHVHQYGWHAALAIVLGKVLRRPVVLKLTSSAQMGIEMALGGGLTGRILGFAHRRAQAFLAVSEEIRSEAVRFGISHQHVHLIPNGVDGQQFYPAAATERAAARRVLGLRCERIVLYVGRLSSEKNTLGLLDAWEAVDTKLRKDALLVLVGDGPDWDAILARSQMPNFAGSVHLAGQRTDVEMWYRAADVNVIPSHLEGLSNTMIEAMASGLPVISTRVSGSSVLVESPAAGLVVEVADRKKLTAAIESLLQDASMRDRFGCNARLKFESRFSLKVMSKEMIGLYKNLVSQTEKLVKA